MPKIAIVAAMEREVSELIKDWARVQSEHQGRQFTFFEHDDIVCICGGIGMLAARRAAEAVIALYCPASIQSVGFSGALDTRLHVGDILTPALVLDARDGSRTPIEGGNGTLITFMEVANAAQKEKLGTAYAAQAVDMEAAAVASAAAVHGIAFSATKVISDEVDFKIPDSSRFITSDGRFRTAGFALFAAIRPWLWMQVAKLALNSRQAAHALALHLQQTILNRGTLTIPAAAQTAGDRR
jgi:nucleoside phosphorylase